MSRLIDFAVWYSGMDRDKVEKAYNRYLKEEAPEVEHKELRDKFFNDLVRNGQHNVPEFSCMPHNVFDWFMDNSKAHNVDNQFKILNSVLDELLTKFDNEEDRADFILDICNSYKKKLNE